MKKIFVSVLCCSSMMFAADAHAEAFSGPFVGVDIGHDTAKLVRSYAWYETNGDFAEETESGRSVSGISGGIFAGYDTQLGGNVFAGVELRAGLSAAKYDSHYHIVVEDIDLDRHNDLTIRAKQTYSATARLGYMINDNTALYVRGGVAQTRFKAKSTPGFPVSFDPNEEEYSYIGSAKDSNTGLVYGAGLESSISDSMNVRIEYNITDYGDVFSKLNERLSAAESLDYGDRTSFGTTMKTHQIRLGVSKHF